MRCDPPTQKAQSTYMDLTGTKGQIDRAKRFHPVTSVVAAFDVIPAESAANKVPKNGGRRADEETYLRAAIRSLLPRAHDGRRRDRVRRAPRRGALPHLLVGRLRVRRSTGVLVPDAVRVPRRALERPPGVLGVRPSSFRTRARNEIATPPAARPSRALRASVRRQRASPSG